MGRSLTYHGSIAWRTGRAWARLKAGYLAGALRKGSPGHRSPHDTSLAGQW